MFAVGLMVGFAILGPLFEDNREDLLERPIAIPFLLMTAISVWRLGFRAKPKIFQEP